MTRATSDWLSQRGLSATPNWQVAITLDDHPFNATVRLHVSMSENEWSLLLERGGNRSWLRVTGDSLAEISPRDEFTLMGQVPRLSELGALVGRIEMRFGVRFRRKYARLETNIGKAETRIRPWIDAL